MSATHPFEPNWVIAPGEILREEIAERGISNRMAAKMCGQIPLATFERILAGAEPISDELAARLAFGFGTSAALWRNLERAYRAGLAAGLTDLTGPPDPGWML